LGEIDEPHANQTAISMAQVFCSWTMSKTFI